MYNYKSRYKMKGLSVYGEPNFSILHKLDKFININKDTSSNINTITNGYIFARKKNNRKKYKYNFEIQINNKIEY